MKEPVARFQMIELSLENSIAMKIYVLTKVIVWTNALNMCIIGGINGVFARVKARVKT